MINLGHDIVLFKKVIPNELMEKLIQLRIANNDTDRINIHEKNIDIFYEFNNFWLETIEPELFDDYFKIYNIDENKGLHVSENTIRIIKEYISAKWRDVFLLQYTPTTSVNSENNVHWDFSELTTVGCLSDGYEGGELVFPRQCVDVKLEMGDVIVFPGGITHPHYVTQTTYGCRDVIVGQSLTLPQDHKINY